MGNYLIVPEANRFPAVCAVTGNPEGPFVDTGNRMRGRVYLGLGAVLDIGRQLGMVEQEDHQAKLAEIDQLNERIAELEAQVAAAKHFESAAKTTLANFGMAVKKQRRPAEATA